VENRRPDWLGSDTQDARGEISAQSGRNQEPVAFFRPKYQNKARISSRLRGRVNEARVQTLRVKCCIAGAGPAGMMLGFLLARVGVTVVVLEKHADFLRDFRGDTIHPSTLELMYELGILEDFLMRPHQELTQLKGVIGGNEVVVADFSHVPTHCKFIALMPQWEFLNFIAEHGKRYPGFQLRMQAEVEDVIEGQDRVIGVRVKTPEGALDAYADLVIGADGRGSLVREKAKLEVVDRGAPIDVLWMRLTRRPEDPLQSLGRADDGQLLIMLDRQDYWQCGLVIRKGGFDPIRQKGLQTFRDDLARLAPMLRDRVSELKDWNQVKLLTVKVDRLAKWYRAGLLCIGDAAHAMSPIGGVGINLAIQDAVAAANALAGPLLERSVSLGHLAEIQKRRMFPTRAIQAIQVFLQNRVIQPFLGSGRTIRKLPLPFRILRRWPILRRVPARVIGIGFRPERVRT
jgi:2-polyprenyl-6-methoxyphenol hydroxylase-like FAD-dependent oxidoreductase